MMKNTKVSWAAFLPLLPAICCAAALLVCFRQPAVVHGTIIRQSNVQSSAAVMRIQPQRLHGTIDVNTADEELLCTVPGIGPATAQRIIAERELNGPFYYAEDLLNVKGIGEKTLKKLEDYLYISDPNAAE